MHPTKTGALASINLWQKNKKAKAIFCCQNTRWSIWSWNIWLCCISRVFMATQPIPRPRGHDPMDHPVDMICGNDGTRWRNLAGQPASIATRLESTILESTAVDLLFCLVLVSLFFLRAEPPPPFRLLLGLTTPSAAGDTFEIGASFLIRVGVFCFTGSLLLNKRQIHNLSRWTKGDRIGLVFFTAKGKCSQTIPKIPLK